MLPNRDANAISIADVPCRDRDAKFILDDASACIQTTMQMSSYKDRDVKILRYKPIVGML